MAVHRYEPTHYHDTIGPHEPVLRIAPGDTVVTSTVDARGHDASGVKITPSTNPQTGPFYIEGVEPGDTLVVHLDRLYPSRDTGWASTAVAPNLVDPTYVRELPVSERAEWHIDRDTATATLMTPCTKLGRLTLPLAPMLGCFGVAPPRSQSISTATAGEHGGNMDYKGFREGVTVYLPVFEQGALFHLGDGHAVQGDGEIVGTGIETSFDVQFSVDVHKDRQIGWPRGENSDHIFAVGNARPLDQALQHATTEMLRWLQDEFGLDRTGACILLGQCVEYDIGNVFDPAYTVVCKLSKSLLGTKR